MRNQSAILDVGAHRRRRHPERQSQWGEEPGHESAAKSRPALAKPAIDRKPREARGDDERSRQNHGKKPPARPEVLRNDSRLVEEEQAEGRQCQEERRVAPEAEGGQRHHAGDGRGQAPRGDVPRERPEGHRVVGRERVVFDSEKVRVDGQECRRGSETDREAGLHGVLQPFISHQPANSHDSGEGQPDQRPAAEVAREP